jgi:hypothetical protein
MQGNWIINNTFTVRKRASRKAGKMKVKGREESTKEESEAKGRKI